MTVYGVLQSLVLALVLLVCVIKLAGQLAPELMRRMRGRIALRLSNHGPVADRVAHWLQPAARIAAGCSQMGSSVGCNSCSLANGANVREAAGDVAGRYLNR